MKSALAATFGLVLVTATDALSMNQVASLWKQNGGSSSSCPTAVAVAWAESRGNPKATGRNSDSYDRGLWQINSKWHPDVSDSCAYNAACNAKNAVRISSGGSRWSPWATYNNGLHHQFMGQANSACASSRDELDSGDQSYGQCYKECKAAGGTRRTCKRRCMDARPNVLVDDNCYRNCRSEGLSKRNCLSQCRSADVETEGGNRRLKKYEPTGWRKHAANGLKWWDRFWESPQGRYASPGMPGGQVDAIRKFRMEGFN